MMISLLIHALANWLLIVSHEQAKSQSKKDASQGTISREVVFTGTNVRRDKALRLFLPLLLYEHLHKFSWPKSKWSDAEKCNHPVATVHLKQC
jgi:hypothetical protein